MRFAHRFSSALCLFVFVATTAVAVPALADAREGADALIAKGVELREKGKDDAALGVFRDALAMSPSARARAQVALAEQALGMWVLAEADLAAALASEGDPWIAKNRSALEGALGVIRQHVATLEVRGAENAEVFLDGVKVGIGAGPFRVVAGRRMLEVRAGGFQSTTHSVDLPGGGIARETVTLVAAAAGPRAAPAGAAEKDEGRRLAHDEDRAPTDDPGRNQRLLGWAFVGTGAALLATGTVGLFVRKGIIDDYNVMCPGLGVAQPASCDDQVSSARTWETISIVALVGGGAFAAGGLVLVATAPSRSTPTSNSTPRARLSCAPTLQAGVVCMGSF